MANNGTLDSFKEDALFPALYERIDSAFPELHFSFSQRGNKWESRYHLNGAKDSQSKVISSVYGNSKFMAIDHSSGKKIGLIDLYMSLNGVDFLTALKNLAEICNLTLPGTDTEEWKEYERKLTNREKAKNTFVSALWEDTEKAKEVREYLHSRKWTDEEIREAELGLITPEIRDSLPDRENYRIVVKDQAGEIIGGIGSTHVLSIPYRSGSRILGFKFREVADKEHSTGTKYLNTKNLHKEGFFGIGIGVKDIVIVEGELDALHAQVRGADNVVATTGGKASKEQIEDAVRKGAEMFTLLYDNDPSGYSYIEPTATELQKAGKDVFIAIFPKGYNDTDDYLAEHSIEEFDRFVRRALPYSQYKLYSIVEEYSKREEEQGEFLLKDRTSFFTDVKSLLNSPYTKAYERKDIYSLLKKYEDWLNFKVEDFKEWVDKEYLDIQDGQRQKAIERAGEKIQEAISGGRIDEAYALMKTTTLEQSPHSKKEEYANVFSTHTPEEYASFLSEIRDGIPTGFKFTQGKQTESLTLNPGLTFICGYRGHGKTSFLNNIAINEARRNIALKNGKSVLYFSYEVDKRRLIVDLINTYTNDPGISKNPSNSIISYFKGEKGEFFKKGYREDGLSFYQYFERKKEEFLREYLSSGALLIVDESYKVESLLEAIKYYISSHKVSIVCIDYAQLIYSESYSRLRTEEIKRVVNDIKDFANKEGIPFVMAAQFNRDIECPVDLDTKSIGEGGDYERIADTCIGLFNLKELHPMPKENDKEKLTKKMIADILGDTKYLTQELSPIEGKLFVRLMKRRYGYYPIDTILNWEGRTKYIEPNDPEALKTDPKQGDIFPEEIQEEGLPF